MAASKQDDERTLITTQRPIDAPSKQRSPWLWAGLVGCAGVICLALLGAGAILLLQGNQELISFPDSQATLAIQVTAATKVVNFETTEPTALSTAVEEAAQPTSTPGALGSTPANTATRTPTQKPPPTEHAPTDTPTPQATKPTIGPITFAVGVTEENQPVDPASSFPADITEIHAVFDYEGMSDTDTWERRWYQGGEEVGSGSGNWGAGEAGTFDLSLSAGGQPLGGGPWKLEIYVNGELAQTGTFSIQASPTATPLPSASVYKLAFARWDGGKHNLYVANTDGSGEQFILERAAGPSWSVNGRALYVYGEEGVDQQVRDGTTYTWPDAGISNGVLLLDLTSQGQGGLPAALQHSTWKEGTARAVALAPSGTMLAYDATHGSPDRRIYFLGTAENQQFNIEIPGEQPSWSPDSNQIVYRSGRDNKTGIWISNRDDSVRYNISNDGSDAFPAWSPDGTSIAFQRDSGDNVDIYVMNVDGSNVRRLTDAPGPDTLPAWTPDGRIVFRSARAGSWEIYIMNGDGSGQKPIIANADPGPDWTFGKMDVY